MPQLGETVTEGTITRWLKQVGDAVAVDDALFEVSTDKVDTEVPSAYAGVLRQILVPEGETVPSARRSPSSPTTADEDLPEPRSRRGARDGALAWLAPAGGRRKTHRR